MKYYKIFMITYFSPLTELAPNIKYAAAVVYTCKGTLVSPSVQAIIEI